MTNLQRLHVGIAMYLSVLGMTPSSAFAQPALPAPDIRSTEVREGDLVLSGHDVMHLEHTHLTINGTIRLSDSARLVIRQSIIEINHYPRQEIFVSGTASLEADTTEFRDFIHAYFSHRSQLRFRNCLFVNLLQFNHGSSGSITDSWIFREPFGLIQLGSSANVEVHNSVCGAFGLEIPGDVPVRIDSLRPGFFERWSARDRISPQLSCTLVLDHCEVKDNPGYSGGYEMGWNLMIRSENDLTISNSVLNKLMMHFHEEDIHFTDLKTRTPIDFRHRGIQLTNTTIQSQWGLFVTDGDMHIENCQGIWLWPIGSGDITAVDTEINEFDPRSSTGTILLKGCSMTNGFEVFENTDATLTGTISMREVSPLFDATSRLRREFPLQIVDAATGRPMPGIPLRLRGRFTMALRTRVSIC